MAAKAFVLIQTEIEVAKTADVVAALKKLGRKVKSVDGITIVGEGFNKSTATTDKYAVSIPSPAIPWMSY